MKRILLTSFLFLAVAQLQAQRFFYVQPNHAADTMLKQRLLSSAQFVTKSPVSSDYIISTEVGTVKESDGIVIRMSVQDSVTMKTIFQTEENCRFTASRISQRILLDLAIRTFIEKNIDRIILTSKEDHVDHHLGMLKERKDKT